jgi:hypothetical protein
MAKAHIAFGKGAKNTKIKCITYFLLSVFWQFHYKTNDFDGYLS